MSILSLLRRSTLGIQVTDGALRAGMAEIVGEKVNLTMSAKVDLPAGIVDELLGSSGKAGITEAARKALVRTITEHHSDGSGRISALSLEPAQEYELRGALKREADGESLAIPPDRALELGRRVAAAWKAAMDQGHDKTVLMCDSRLRPHLAGLLCRQLPQLSVLAYDEIAIGTQIESVATVNLTPQETVLAGATRGEAGA